MESDTKNQFIKMFSDVSEKMTESYVDALKAVATRLKENPLALDAFQMCKKLLEEKKEALAKLQEQITKSNEETLLLVLKEYETKLLREVGKLQKEFDVLNVVNKYVLPILK